MPSCEVKVVELPDGFVQRCKKCQEILEEGNFVICLTLHGVRSSKKFFLSTDPQEHCGEQRVYVQAFKYRAEAEAEERRMFDHLVRTGSIKGLRLISLSDPNMN